MRKKMTAIGNSWAVIIEKPLMDAMNITPKETEFEVKTVDNLIILEPIRPDVAGETFEQRVRRLMKKHDKTLRKLAAG
jgi:antitoxin component of MazEF toxin-antitoxin module